MKQLLLLVLILLFGAFVRILHIEEQSLWVDEGYAVYHSNHPSLIESLSVDTHPPLYFASFRIWQEFTGRSEFALRYFSFIAGMLNLALMYPLAKEFVALRGKEIASASVPLLAVFLLALADSEIFLSQEARHYTWHVFLAMGSMWGFLRWLRTGQHRWLIVWIIFTVVLSYTHYIGTFVGVTQGMYALVFLRGKQRWTALGALVVSALLLLPWLLTVGVQQLDSEGAGWSTSLSSAFLEDMRLRYFSSHWALMIGLTLLGTVTITYGDANNWRIRWKPVKNYVLPVLWIVVPFVLILIVNEFLPFLQPRRLSQIAPPIAILIAFGLGNIRQPIRGFLVIVIFFASIASVDFYREKPPWRELGLKTAEVVINDELVLTDIAGGDYQVQYYYNELLPDSVDIRSLKVWRDFDPDTYEAGLPELLESQDSLWLMHWSDDQSAFRWLDRLGFVQTAELLTPHQTGENTEYRSVFRFEIPPENPVAEFDNGMILWDAEIDPALNRIHLLWSSDRVMSSDYTISVKLLDSSGDLMAQVDEQPLMNQRPTSTWNPGELVFDSKTWTIDSDMANNAELSVVVEIYEWTPEGIINIPTASGEPWYAIDSIQTSIEGE